MKRMQSKKSHSWWWDSHISAQNSKWLSENLEEMDKQYKEMLRLIGDEGESVAKKAQKLRLIGDEESVAKKAEMPYQQPLLITHVENFYRMYRALAERYGNVTGELRKNIPSSLKSPGSFGISESDSETQSPASLEPDLEKKTPQKGQKPRLAGFDIFLGSGGSSDISGKGGSGDFSSSSESDSELDEVKEGHGNGISYALNQRIIELEGDLYEAREKLKALEEKNMLCRCDLGANGDPSALNSKMSELEKLPASDNKIYNLQKELETMAHYLENLTEVKSEKTASEAMMLANKNEIDGLKGVMASAAKQYEAQLDINLEIEKCKQELQRFSEKYLQDKSSLEAEIGELQEVLKNFEANKLQLESRVNELENSLDDSAAEIVKLQEVITNTQVEIEKVSHEKKVLEERVFEFEQVSVEVKTSRAEVESLEERVKNLKAELDRVLKEKSMLGDRVKDMELVMFDLNASFTSSLEKHSLEKSSLKAELVKLSETNAFLEDMLASVEAKLKQVNAEKSEVSIESENQISGLNRDVVDLSSKLELLLSEKAAVDNKVTSLLTDIMTRDEMMKQMEEHLNQLHLEHDKLIADAGVSQKVLSEVRSRVYELEDEVEKQKLVISESAEGKREAIRQLCFSLEHYRIGYQELRQLLQGHRRPMVMAP